VGEHKAVALNGMVGQAARQVYADPDPSLMQIGTPVGCLGRQPQHRHGRLVSVKNYPNVRNALVGDSLETRVQANALLQ